MKGLEKLFDGEVLTWGKSVFELNEAEDINECDCNDGTCQDKESERMDWCRSEW